MYYAVHDPRTPLLSKIIPWFVLAYALSPLDLIPDFIPVLGFLDDMLLLPLGLWLSYKLIPAEVGRCLCRRGGGVRVPCLVLACALFPLDLIPNFGPVHVDSSYVLGIASTAA